MVQIILLRADGLAMDVEATLDRSGLNPVARTCGLAYSGYHRPLSALRVQDGTVAELQHLGH